MYSSFSVKVVTLFFYKKVHFNTPQCILISLLFQLSDLKLGVVERNQVINEMRRHLLVQEVTNLLLQADIRRRELQLRFFRQRKRNIHEKRWKTYGGVELWTREVR